MIPPEENETTLRAQLAAEKARRSHLLIEIRRHQAEIDQSWVRTHEIEAKLSKQLELIL